MKPRNELNAQCQMCVSNSCNIQKKLHPNLCISSKYELSKEELHTHKTSHKLIDAPFMKC